MTNRFDELSHWLRHDVGISKFTIAPASSDASFRRYFRIMYDDKSVIAMDAPPETENSRQYVIIAQLLHDMGLNVPVILEADLAHGFLLISDLGDRTYLNELTENNAHHLYDDAIEALVKMQIAGPSEEGVLPGYNETLLKREMGLFPEWFLYIPSTADLSASWHPSWLYIRFE